VTITLSQEDNNEPVAEHGGINHARVYPMLALRRWASISELEHRVAAAVRPVSLLALRVSLGVVFIWFGALKVANVTPVAALVAGTVPWVDPAWFVPLLGTVEVVVGIALIAGRRLTAVSCVLVAHLTGTLLVLVMEPQVAFEHGNPLLLTTVGEFVMKNVVLISAGLVLASRQDARRKGCLPAGR
jgi:putative oxidoreductase